MHESQPSAITEDDLELLASARAIIATRQRFRWHQIGAALRTTSGTIYAAVHLEANIGRVAICAEAIALGMAVAAGDGTIETIVAVDTGGGITPPCGMCREMIADYAPNARVLLSLDNATSALMIATLLPHRSPPDYLP